MFLSGDTQVRSVWLGHLGVAVLQTMVCTVPCVLGSLAALVSAACIMVPVLSEMSLVSQVSLNEPVSSSPLGISSSLSLWPQHLGHCLHIKYSITCFCSGGDDVT